MADAAREAQLRRLFDEAMALPEPRRAPFAAGVDDELLRERLLALLQQDVAATATSLRDPLVQVDLGLRRVGHYELLRPLGSGGMGVVMLARQVEPIERLVAIKLVHVGHESTELLQRFRSEQRALGRMDHAGIARVLDGGTTDTGQPYFVMEYVRGEPITAYCDRRRLTVAQRMRLLAQVCDAVQHAHQKGVIHRDLKPGNVLVTEVSGRPQPKVIDFGIARAVAGSLATMPPTRAGDVVGTLLYMSPEQAVPDQEVDTRTDIWSLGAIGFELAVGQTPLTIGSDPAALLRFRTDLATGPPTATAAVARLHPTEAAARAERRSTAVAAWRRQLGEDVGQVLATALQPDRNRRYPTASELANDLQRALAGEPVRARPPTWTYLTWRFVQRHRRLVAAAGVSFAAVVAGTVAAVAGMLEARAARDLEAAARARLAAVVDRQRATEEFSQFVQLYGDPGTSGVAPSLRQALTAAEGVIGVRWRDRPRERAAVRAALGRTLLHLGEPIEARRNLQQAWDLAVGFRDDDLGWSLDVLAALRRAANDTGDLGAARTHLVAMLELGARGVRERSGELAALLAAMASAMPAAATFPPALVGDCARAVAIVDGSPSRSELLRTAGPVLFGVALAARAEGASGGDALLQRVEGIARTLYGDDIEFAFLLGYLAENRWRLADADAALQLADELLAVLARLDRTGHWLGAQAGRLRALALVARGDDAAGEQELLRLRDRLLEFRVSGNAQVRAAVEAPAELAAWLLARDRLDAFLQASFVRAHGRGGSPTSEVWWPAWLDGAPAPVLTAVLATIENAAADALPAPARDASTGAVLLRLGRSEAAWPLLERALAASPQPTPELLADAAVLRQRRGDRAGADAALAQLQRLGDAAGDAALRLRCELARERIRTALR
jgi:serine/threonine protein kinase/tetratricopeptide (TPR) repeat protein